MVASLPLPPLARLHMSLLQAAQQLTDATRRAFTQAVESHQSFEVQVRHQGTGQLLTVQVRGAGTDCVQDVWNPNHCLYRCVACTNVSLLRLQVAFDCV